MLTFSILEENFEWDYLFNESYSVFILYLVQKLFWFVGWFLEHKNTDEEVLSLFFDKKLLVPSDLIKLDNYVFLISKKFLFSLLNVEVVLKLFCFKVIFELLFLSIIFFLELEPI